MRAAPPVSVRAGGGTLWHALNIVLPALAAGVLAGWLLAHAEPEPDWAIGVGAVAEAALAGWVAWLAVRRSRPVELGWDGEQWSADGVAGRLEVMIDLQQWLLLRLRPGRGSRPRWIAVAEDEAGAALPLLRAALHAGAEPSPSLAPEPTPALEAPERRAP
jgi:hypothetical protein